MSDMGQAARRVEAEPFRINHLRLVPDPPVRPARRTSAAARNRARTEELRARSLFTMFLTLMIATVFIGGVRVAFIARAAEASLSESRLQADIASQRAVRDKLEVERSSLSSPSRIAGIAEETMEMGEPKSVRYVTIEADAAAADDAIAVAVSSDAGPFERVFGAIMQLSAGEAQSLLVGDLGLAGSR